MVWISYSLETDIPADLERHCTLYNTGRFFTLINSCVQGDLLKTLSTHELISSLPRNFIHLSKENRKEGETLSGNKRIWNIYICIPTQAENSGVETLLPLSAGSY